MIADRGIIFIAAFSTDSGTSKIIMEKNISFKSTSKNNLKEMSSNSHYFSSQPIPEVATGLIQSV